MILDQVMSRSVVTIDARATVLDARELLRKHPIHHLVAVDRGRVVGVVSFRALIGKRDTEKVFEAMSRDFSVATPQTTMRDAAAMMIGRGTGCLPVVDNGRIAGIITTSDLLKLLNTAPGVAAGGNGTNGTNGTNDRHRFRAVSAAREDAGAECPPSDV